ncbi:MAG: HK97 gp10 family phage protein [Comamonadaceae bacterium]|nr:MAG: HK97 gp10 family phage protein [Comamonadaceae bacterium]
MTLRITVNILEVEQYLDALGDDAKAAARPAAQAAAQVFYDAVQRNVAGIGKKTGNLASSIYQAYSKSNSNRQTGMAIYAISWNSKKAPHAHLVEHGYIQKFKVYMGKDGVWYTNKQAPLAQPRQVGARPFIRPALAKREDAMLAAEDVYIKALLKRG